MARVIQATYKKGEHIMKKEIEEKIAGICTLLFGIVLIALGIIIHDKLWFTVLMTSIGTIFSIYALQYLTRKRH